MAGRLIARSALTLLDVEGRGTGTKAAFSLLSVESTVTLVLRPRSERAHRSPVPTRASRQDGIIGKVDTTTDSPAPDLEHAHVDDPKYHLCEHP